MLQLLLLSSWRGLVAHEGSNLAHRIQRRLSNCILHLGPRSDALARLIPVLSGCLVGGVVVDRAGLGAALFVVVRLLLKPLSVELVGLELLHIFALLAGLLAAWHLALRRVLLMGNAL